MRIILLVSNQYLKTTVQILVHFAVSSIFFILLNPISATIIFVTTYIIPDVIEYDKEYENIGEKIEAGKINSFASDICEEYNLGSVDIRQTKSSSGVLIQRLWNTDIILVPNSTNPKESSDEALAVVAHELCHKKNRDSLINYTLVLLLSLLIGFIASLVYAHGIAAIMLYLFSVSSVTPLGLNYISHRNEFRADSFASDKVNKKAVLSRLRCNKSLKTDSKLKYKKSHPEVQERIRRVREK